MDLVAARALPHPWLVGWSFGTEVALKWGLEQPVEGAILLIINQVVVPRQNDL